MKKTLLLITLLACSSVAQADRERSSVPTIYGGGDIGVAAYEYQDVEGGAAYRGFAGAEFGPEPVRFVIEGAYLSTGEAEVSGRDRQLELSGYTVTVGLAFREKGYPLGAYVRGGFYNLTSELSTRNDVLLEESETTGATFSVGMDYQLMPNLAVRGEITWLAEPEDYSHDEDVSLLTLGLMARF